VSFAIVRDENFISKASPLFFIAVFIWMPPLNVLLSVEVKIDFGSS